ncbi:MAG: 50S ribosomal protein L4 [Candidatus Nanohaloarchaeota archaeon QJJ-7]|nr:50S ribosomal protein L4 [Candidatus Nanohaloarchaeota archaeon QJJ-7]
MVKVRDADGKKTDELDLPLQFRERVRPDIIKKAVLSAQSKRRQRYGADEESGLKHVTHWKKRSRAYRGIRGRSYPSSRTPRKITFRRGMQMSGPGGEAPQAVGGRKAHPPKSEKDFEKDINDKERRKGIRSAVAATMDEELVQERGHVIGDTELPLVVDSSVEELESTSDVVDLLEELGLEGELDRVRDKQSRAGKGANRGRPTREKAGPLLVVGEDQGISKAARNIPGVEVREVEHMDAEVLAPGTEPGRLVVWSENAVEKLEEEELFR